MTSKKTKSHLFSAVAIGFMYIHAIYRVYIYIYIYFFFIYITPLMTGGGPPVGMLHQVYPKVCYC